MLGCAGCVALGAGACHPNARPSPAAPPRPEAPRVTGRALPLPARAHGALSGSALVEAALSLRPAERERLIVDEIDSGNLPPFERRLVEVRLSSGSLSGRIWVTPDYLAVGTDEDWVRVPMTIRSAKAIARTAASLLPTKKLVDTIHAAASVRISSPYMAPGRDMASVEYFAAHHAAIEERRRRAGGALGQLVSGPKKDLVISRRSQSEPGRTPIYGWFADDGRAIQGLSLVHDDRYLDYAHGVRLVLRTMEVDGREADLLDVLADRELAGLVSDEGHFDIREAWARGW